MNKFSYDEAFEIIITKPTAKADHITLIDKNDISKHLAGRHNQKTHGGGMGPKWEKGEWHEMSNKDYVAFIDDSCRLAESKYEKRIIPKSEWKKNYARTDEEYLKAKPERAYKNGQIVVFSEPGDNPSKHQTKINEGSLIRDIDDLQTQYPLESLVLRISDKRLKELAPDKDAFGATDRGGNKMLLAGDALFPRPVNNVGMGMGSVVGVRTYTLTHEWGHALDRPNLESSNFGERDNIITKLVEADYNGRAGTNMMSEYGKSEPAEAFAEGFAQYVLSQQRNVPAEGNPLAVAMAERFGWDKPWKK